MENKQDKGFTLVELLIVIVILGILATVTVFAVRGITDRGQENACSVDARTLSTSIEAYYAQNQEDPAAIGDLTGGTEPVLKEVPSNFTFVASVADGADPTSYTFPANTWGAGSAAVTISNADSAIFIPTDGGACDVAA